jgi:3D (Asp-Asp-Asp) domain-containing protein
MKRILACLAAVAIAASATAAQAQGDDPIGDLIAKTVDSSSSAGAPGDSGFRVTLYHSRAHGVGKRDSLGCPVSAMRTLAVDPAIIARHSIVYIKETAGMIMPDGTLHDGYWYASDIGGAIKGARLDLFTGDGPGSMRPLAGLNLKSVTLTKVGQFAGCPPTDGGGMAPSASPTIARDVAIAVDPSPVAAAE